MTNLEMLVKVEERNKLAGMIKELQAQMDTLDTDLKNEMVSRTVEEMLVGGHTVRYKEVTSNRFDKKKFTTELGEGLYNKYCSPCVTMRFTVS